MVNTLSGAGVKSETDTRWTKSDNTFLAKRDESTLFRARFVVVFCCGDLLCIPLWLDKLRNSATWKMFLNRPKFCHIARHWVGTQNNQGRGTNCDKSFDAVCDGMKNTVVGFSVKYYLCSRDKKRRNFLAERKSKIMILYHSGSFFTCLIFSPKKTHSSSSRLHYFVLKCIECCTSILAIGYRPSLYPESFLFGIFIWNISYEIYETGSGKRIKVGSGLLFMKDRAQIQIEFKFRSNLLSLVRVGRPLPPEGLKSVMILFQSSKHCHIEICVPNAIFPQSFPILQ